MVEFLFIFFPFLELEFVGVQLNACRAKTAFLGDISLQSRPEATEPQVWFSFTVWVRPTAGRGEEGSGGRKGEGGGEEGRGGGRKRRGARGGAGGSPDCTPGPCPVWSSAFHQRLLSSPGSSSQRGLQERLRPPILRSLVEKGCRKERRLSE